MKILMRLLCDAKSQWLGLITVCLLLLGGAAFEVSAPVLLGQVLDAIVNGLQAQEDMGAVIEATNMTVLILLLLYLGHAVCTYFAEAIMGRVSAHVVLGLRPRVSQHLFKLPISYYDDHGRGDLLSRLTGDLDAVGEIIRENVPGMLSALIGLVGAILMMLYLSPLLGGIILAIVGLGVAGLTAMGRYMQATYLRQQEALGAYNDGIDELLNGKLIIESYGLHAYMRGYLGNLNSELFKSDRNATFLGQVIFPLIAFLNQISYVVTAVLGGIMVLHRTITVGDIQAFFLYVTQVSDPISRISYILAKTQEAVAALGRIYSVLDAKEEEDKGAEIIRLDKSAEKAQLDTGVARTSLTSYDIIFDGIDFGYSPDKMIIKNLSISIPQGAKVAIVGPTGAGKTTLVNLLMRYYEPQAGSIRIGGQDIRHMSRHSLHQIIGMVLQETWMFEGSIADNIAYGKPGATRQDVEEVAKMAMADYFIRTLPQGYDTPVTAGGLNLSVGQRQLITIARAFLANPAILILDEATANVDTRTEVNVQAAMNRLLQGRTGIIIAHRLSTIRDADVILVVKDGTVVEQGSQEELLAKGGFYKELHDNYVQGMTV